MSRTTQGRHLYRHVNLKFPILHAKFQDHWTSVSEKKSVLKDFAICMRGDHLGRITRTIYINCPLSKRDPTLALIGHAVSEAKIFENNVYKYTCK